MAFSTIHTTYGLSRMAAAEAAGVPINLTHMAVGDGGGNPVEPDINQSTLVREKYRAPVNRVYQNADNPTQFIAELIVPKSEGGFTLRELAVFDDTGGMFVVGNLPDAYMPADGEGAFSDAVVRCIFQVSNASVVTIMIDPAVAIASQQWVINNINPATLIPGGLTGQYLAKQSNDDGDYEWRDVTDVNVTVDCIEEVQTLAALQTQVDWSTLTTDGLAVYIEGVRLRRGAGADEWQPNPADDFTSIILGKSYPAGTKIVGAQNDPLGTAVEPLERSQNLADVLDKPLARTNLDIFSKSETRQMAPAGLVAFFARTAAPSGWLKANGALVSRSAYADLFAAIGTTFGEGDGTTTFRLPDMRGEFPRGWDDGRGVDGGRTIGSAQFGAIQQHNHSATTSDAGNHTHSGSATNAGSHNHAASTGVAGGHAHTYNFGSASGGSGGSVGSSDAKPGTYTTSGAGDHSHSVSVGISGDHTHPLSINSGGVHSHTVSVGNTGEAETRPRNIALLACIKF